MAAALKLKTRGGAWSATWKTGEGFMKQETKKPEDKDLPPPGRRPTAREVYQQEIARNPRWRNTTTAGPGFIIGGARPSKESAT
jgi:hypothetical protein